jgi:hypothetical protein
MLISVSFLSVASLQLLLLRGERERGGAVCGSLNWESRVLAMGISFTRQREGRVANVYLFSKLNFIRLL